MEDIEDIKKYRNELKEKLGDIQIQIDDIEEELSPLQIEKDELINEIIDLNREILKSEERRLQEDRTYRAMNDKNQIKLVVN